MSGPSAGDSLKNLTCMEKYLAICVCFVNIVNYIDRIGIASVLIKVQETFMVGDANGGLLQTALLMAITFSAPIFGYSGDRFSRKWLIIVCMLIWCVSTIMGALASHFWMLVLSRVLVGVGQSGFTTITPTVISDIALGGTRSVLLAIFYLGIPLGGGLGYIICVTIAKLTNWRYGICVGPILCAIGIILLSLAKFPRRGQKELNANDNRARTQNTFFNDFKYLMSIKSFLSVTAAYALFNFLVGAVAWWMPKCLYTGFQLRSSEQIEITKVGFYFGLITVVTGILGVVIGSTLSKLLRKRFPRADPYICGIGLLLGTPFMAICYTLIAESQIVTYILIFLSMVCVSVNWAVVVDILLYTTMPLRRTMAQGVNMLVTHAFGDCISPYIVGCASDYLKANYQFTNSSFFLPCIKAKPNDINSFAQTFHSLQLSLFLVVIFGLLSATFFFITSYFIVKDTERASVNTE